MRIEHPGQDKPATIIRAVGFAHNIQDLYKYGFVSTEDATKRVPTERSGRAKTSASSVEPFHLGLVAPTASWLETFQATPAPRETGSLTEIAGHGLCPAI